MLRLGFLPNNSSYRRPYIVAKSSNSQCICTSSICVCRYPHTSMNQTGSLEIPPYLYRNTGTLIYICPLLALPRIIPNIHTPSWQSIALWAKSAPIPATYRPHIINQLTRPGALQPIVHSQHRPMRSFPWRGLGNVSFSSLRPHEPITLTSRDWERGEMFPKRVFWIRGELNRGPGGENRGPQSGMKVDCQNNESSSHPYDRTTAEWCCKKRISKSPAWS
jgi:hypothetical protein